MIADLAILSASKFRLIRKNLRLGPRNLFGIFLIGTVSTIIGVARSNFVAALLTLVLGLTFLFATVFFLNLFNAFFAAKNQLSTLRSQIKIVLNEQHSMRQKVITQQQKITTQEQKITTQEQKITTQEQKITVQNESMMDSQARELELRVNIENLRLDANDEKKSRDVLLRLSAQLSRNRIRFFVYQALEGKNDYVRMIYSAFAEHGFDVISIAKRSDFDSLKSGDVLHIHWTKTFSAHATSIFEADKMCESWLSMFQQLKDRGVFLIWAVHEALPHECRFPEVESNFRNQLAQLSDVVQILHESTPDAVRDIFFIQDEKVVVVPHPLYVGAQPDYISRREARARLGIKPTDLVLSTFGAIRPYKNHRAVLDTLQNLEEQMPGRKLVYLIAGPIQRGSEIDKYLNDLRTAIDSNRSSAVVRMFEGALPTADLQVIQKASDISVCPYSAGLNSGVLMLNLTFGLSTVISSNPVSEDIAQFGPVYPISSTSADHLGAHLLHVANRGTHREVDSGFRSSHLPRIVSSRFANEVKDRLASR